MVVTPLARGKELTPAVNMIYFYSHMATFHKTTVFFSFGNILNILGSLETKNLESLPL
jgi:hypothetical protein